MEISDPCIIYCYKTRHLEKIELPEPHIHNLDDSFIIPIKKIIKKCGKPNVKINIKISRIKKIGKFERKSETEIELCDEKLLTYDKFPQDFTTNVNGNWMSNELTYGAFLHRNSLTVTIDDLCYHIDHCHDCENNFKFLQPDNGYFNKFGMYLPIIFPCGESINDIFDQPDVCILELTVS